jgi:hypothetical protein
MADSDAERKKRQQMLNTFYPSMAKDVPPATQQIAIKSRDQERAERMFPSMKPSERQRTAVAMPLRDTSDSQNSGSDPYADMLDNEMARGDNPEMLRFNGRNLQYILNGKVVREWPAVSGRPNRQSKEYQYERNQGPIPEGKWQLGERQDINSIGSWDRVKGFFGGGSWRGLEDSWGNHRIWLNPDSTTETRGRSGFSIHGGAEAGSAGCIDLTDQMDDFHDFMKNKSNNIPVVVDYSR